MEYSKSALKLGKTFTGGKSIEKFEQVKLRMGGKSEDMSERGINSERSSEAFYPSSSLICS
jgi:hypothetical protein